MIEDFSKVAAPRPDGSLSGFALIDAILQERPDLKGQPVCVPKQGVMGYTVFIGDEVFKAPHLQPDDSNLNRWAFKGFNQEVDAMEKLKGKKLPVPELTCVGRDFLFFGMTRVPGAALRDYKDSLTSDEQINLARDLVDFQIKLANATQREDGSFLVHDDLNLDNVRIDPLTKRLASIIDFGLISYVDRSSNKWGSSAALMGPIGAEIWEELQKRKHEFPEPRLASNDNAVPQNKIRNIRP